MEPPDAVARRAFALVVEAWCRRSVADAEPVLDDGVLLELLAAERSGRADLHPHWVEGASVARASVVGAVGGCWRVRLDLDLPGPARAVEVWDLRRSAVGVLVQGVRSVGGLRLVPPVAADPR